MSYGVGSSTSREAQYQALFAKIDKDNNKKVSKDEFVAGAPPGVDPNAAASLFNLLDTKKTGELSSSDLATAFSNLTTSLQSLLIQTQSDQQGGQNGAPNTDALFAKLDKNGDGKVSKDEFIAGRPKNISEEQASKVFDQISGGETDGIGKEDLARLADGHGRGGSQSGAGDADDSKFDPLDTNKDGIVSLDELLAGEPLANGKRKTADATTDLFGAATSTDALGNPLTSSSDSSGKLVDSLLELISKDGNGTPAANTGSLFERTLQAINAYQDAAQSSLAA